MKKQTNLIDSKEKNMNTKGPSKMAERVAFIRFAESIKPEAERICYDPYAIHFISQEASGLSRDTQKTKDAHEYYETHFPGLANSVRARVRYFDDFVKNSLNEGLEQLVILGAGYDTRAYRIEGLKCRVRVFEVDHPRTQSVKIEKIKKVFGYLPDHVTFVPVDFETENFGEKLIEYGYD
jgi:methyltransferase (TIGR00027 family)